RNAETEPVGAGDVKGLVATVLAAAIPERPALRRRHLPPAPQDRLDRAPLHRLDPAAQEANVPEDMVVSPALGPGLVVQPLVRFEITENAVERFNDFPGNAFAVLVHVPPCWSRLDSVRWRDSRSRPAGTSASAANRLRVAGGTVAARSGQQGHRVMTHYDAK